MIISADKVISCKVITEAVFSEKEGIAVNQTTIEDIAIEGLKLGNLSGVESKCAELQTDFAEGEDLFVISAAKFENNSVKLADVIYVIKEAALEDFTARLIKNASKPE